MRQVSMQDPNGPSTQLSALGTSFAMCAEGLVILQASAGTGKNHSAKKNPPSDR